MRRGFFITFEGGEGAGKSVQVEILANHLREEGYEVVVTREPGGTRIGELIRLITHNPENVDLLPITEAYLMAASRAQHVSELIKPALTSGKIVVCDRFIDSSLAYQGYGRGLGVDKIKNLNKMAINSILPDLTLFLNLSPQAGVKRLDKSAKAKDRLDFQRKEFYERVYKGYQQIAKQYRDRYVTIDASKPIEKVASEVWEKVKSALKKHHEKR